MSEKRLSRLCLIILMAFVPGIAAADEEAEYNRRAAQRDLALFGALDRNADGALSRDEARGDLTLGPRFDDADIDRNGILTRAEIERYVEQRYGVNPSAASETGARR